jgi:hypothetical protein
MKPTTEMTADDPIRARRYPSNNVAAILNASGPFIRPPSPLG